MAKDRLQGASEPPELQPTQQPLGWGARKLRAERARQVEALKARLEDPVLLEKVT